MDALAMAKGFHEIAVTEMTGGEWRVCVQWEEGAPTQAFLPEQARARADAAERAGDEEVARCLRRAADQAESRARDEGPRKR